jgi:chromosome segregation ATPase
MVVENIPSELQDKIEQAVRKAIETVKQEMESVVNSAQKSKEGAEKKQAELLQEMTPVRTKLSEMEEKWFAGDKQIKKLDTDISEARNKVKLVDAIGVNKNPHWWE